MTEQPPVNPPVSHTLTEVTYSKGVTIQMRDYEPVNIHISAKATLSSDTPENRTTALQDIEKFVKDELINEQTVLLAQRKQIMEMANKQRQPDFNNIPPSPQTQTAPVVKEGWPETKQPSPPTPNAQDLIYINDEGNRDPYAEIRMQEPPF